MFCYLLLVPVEGVTQTGSHERVNIYSILYFIDGCAIAVKVKK